MKALASRWVHAAGADDDVSATPDGRVMQQRGPRTYARGPAGWQAASPGEAGAAAAVPAAAQTGGFFDAQGRVVPW